MDSPIWMKVGCDAECITKLINKGMDLTQRSSFFNETVLHYWAGGLNFSNVAVNDGVSYQEDLLRVVKLLIEKGADLLALDNWGFTPLLQAANGGSYRGDLPNLAVLNFLLKREEYSRADKIEAMELAGAVILQNTKHASLFHIAFDYWRKALQLRHMEVEGSGFIEKPQLNLKNIQTTEWNTSAELEDIIEHPDKFVIQSFLVRLRICFSKKWGAMNIFILYLLDDYFWEPHQHQLSFLEIFDIIWALLETLFRRSDLRENKAVQWKMRSIFEKLIQVFSCLTKDSSEIQIDGIIKKSFYFIASATEFCPIFSYLVPFVRILSKLPQLLLNKCTLEMLSKVRDQHGRNLLHEAIFGATLDDDLYATVRFLLYAGCHPNVIDKNGYTSLHCLSHLNQQYFKGDLNTIAVLLLDFGAQLSRKNVYGKTAVDLLIRNMKQEIIGWKLPDWCTELSTLTCLSARVIRRNRIPYLELPATLIPMIEKHKITKQ